MPVLVVNTGSSSLKLSLIGREGDVESSRTVDDWQGDDEPIRELAGELTRVDAVGHRVVHGGTDFVGPALVDEGVIARLRDLVALAPLHQPRALAAIDAARRAVPHVPHGACFDTAFHATLSAAARTYALPAAWRERWPVRRFGFHGISHAYVARRVAELARRPVEELRIVSCHLGAGASLCAIAAGRSVDTTMGFSPLEGLVMATRAGSVDPGLVLWLVEQGGLAPADVRVGLEGHSGLLGLCGMPGMKEVLAARREGNRDAQLAFEVYAHRLRRELGAMSAVLGGVDAVAFTGGVGEHAAEVRDASGLALDPAANASTTADGEIGAAGAAVRAFVVTAREDLEIARLTREVVASG